MIPTLYKATATSFNDNGLGALPELYDAEVVEKANDILELTATYPVSGQRYDDLVEDAIILAKPNSRDDEHAFRISDLELDITGENVTITAYSITNDLGGNLITDLVISDADGQTAMTNLQNAVESETRFKFVSDITTKSSTHFQMVSPLEAVAGTTGSLLQIWGGEIKRENDQISLLTRRGYDDVTTFRLGKNISGLKYAIDTSSVVTRIYPYYSKTVDGGTSLIRGATVDSKYIGNYPYVHIKSVDVSQEITVTEDMTDAQIKTAVDAWAKDWFTKSANTSVDKPSVTISLDVLELSGSSELEGKLATLEQLGLFDTVTLFVPEYKIDVTAKVNELHYDPMARRVTSLVAGTVKTSVFSQQSNALSIVQAAVSEAKNQADYAAVSANGKNTNFYGDAEPLSPKDGDIWYTTELIDGKKEDVIKTFTNGIWTELVTSATGRQIAHDVDAKMEQLNADMSVANSNLQAAQQDVADLQVKLKANDDTQAQLTKDLSENSTILAQAQVDIVTNTQALSDLDTKLKANDDAQAQLQDDLAANTKVQDQLKKDLSDNTELMNQVKTDTTNSLEKVNEDLTQAKSDAAQAVKHVDKAVANAQSAADASGLATQTAKAASDAALAAKNLATSTANSFATVKTQADQAVTDASTAKADANTAKANATQAINDAAAAKGQAANALGQAGTAIDNAANALDKFNNLQVGGRNLYLNSKSLEDGYARNNINTTITVEPFDSTTNMWHIVAEQGIGLYIGMYLKDYANDKLPDSSDWSYSADVKGTGKVRTFGIETGNHNPIVGTVGTEWSRISQTGHVDNEHKTLVMYFDCNSSPLDVYIKLPKLEIGNTPTDWSPAPEDVQQQFTDINGELANKVSQTTYNTLAGTVDTVNTLAKQNQSTISTLATSASVDAVSGRVTKAQSLAEQTANGLTFKADKSVVGTIDGTVKQQGIDLKVAQGELKLKMTQNDLTKGLDGYATQDWAQNQIKLTADGINGTISSVKNTVDSQTTSINDLKADSSSFKSQFTKVNNTLGTHTTDISSLQVSSKELTTGFNTLTTDNRTNKNDISQLKQTATEVSSTLMTVQQQVTDSAVGINLLRNARTLDGWGVWTGYGHGKGLKFEDISLDGVQYRMAHITNYIDEKSSDAPFWPGENLVLNAGQVYTISIWAHSLGTSEQPVSWTLWLNRAADDNYQAVEITKTTSPNWKRYSATFTVPVSGEFRNVRIVPKFGTGAAANVGGSVYLLKPKLEKGSVATDFSVNPADNATVTAVSTLSQTVDGLSATFAKKTDLATTASNLKVTADGLNLLTTATGAKGEKVTQVIADVNNIKTTMTGDGGYTSRLQTLEGFQQTATAQIAGKAETSQVTQLSNELVSVVGGLGQQNLVYNSEFDNSMEGWTTKGGWGVTNYDWSTGEAGGIVINSTDPTMTIVFAASKDVPVTGGQYSAAADLTIASATGTTSYAQLYVQFLDDSGAQTSYKYQSFGLGEVGTTISGKTHVKLEGITPDANAKTVRLILRVAGAVYVRWQHPMLVNAPTVGAYQADTVGGSQITQLQDMIDLRVNVDGKIAAALNLSADGGGTVTIRGASLYVTAASHFDAASIQSAAIANLDATKITSGSISADRLATTKLNADNITSGSIAAERLATTKLNADNITSGEINASLITTGDLNADRIHGGTFDASKMTVKNINAGSITSGSIATKLLASTKINADNITSGSIAAARIATTALSATNITSGTLDVGKLTVKNLSADLIASGTIDASKIAVKNLSASNIIGGTLDASTMTVKNIDAAAITTGTLNAASLNVVGLNASAITTGTITGANLAINLGTGEVMFQKGSIKSTTGTLDIEIEDGTFSQRNNLGAGFLMSQGNLYFSATSFWEALDKNEYALSTLMPDYGYLGFGDMIATKRGMALYGKDALSLGLIDTSLSVDYFDNKQGFISIKKDDSMTVHGGGNGLFLVGGPRDTGTAMPTSPYIRVGSSTDGKSSGNRIYTHAAYIIAPSIYKQTTGNSANVVVYADGSLHRSTSASKYKTMIERSRSTRMAEALLSLPTAHWLDKAEIKNYENGEQSTTPTRYFGMIAEDLAGAGLEELVVRGDDGELEGINYDRIAPALLPLLAQMKQEIEELKGEK